MLSVFTGTVIKGDGLGKKLGFPTANVEIGIKKADLLDGVYSAQAWLNSDQYRAVLVVRNGVDKIEVFLLDYVGKDFYGKELKVDVGKKINEIGKFSSEENLREKIKDDILKAKGSFEIVQD